MDRLDVEVRPLAEAEVALVERHLGLDWGYPDKHRQRLALQRRGELVYLIAWHQGAPVGHVMLRWSGAPDPPVASRLRDCPDIEDLFVLPQHRSRGIGSRLLDHAEGLARAQGYAQVGLGVGVDNPRARALYERRGYRDAGFGQYTVAGWYLDRDGVEKRWQETCNYLVKALVPLDRPSSSPRPAAGR